jgi:hypothetical protein
VEKAMTINNTSEAAKAVVRRNTEEVQGGGNFEVFDELFADETGSASAFVHRDQTAFRPARKSHDGVPVVYFERYFVTGGGLLSYGPDFVDQYRHAALRQLLHQGVRTVARFTFCPVETDSLAGAAGLDVRTNSTSLISCVRSAHARGPDCRLASRHYSRAPGFFR